MAILTNSQNTYAQIGIREDLVDMVYRIDPEEVPFQSNISTAGKMVNTFQEWQVQTLTSPSKSNHQLEGDDSVSATAAVARVRLKNYASISKKTFAVTGTGQAVNIAGVDNELNEQTLLRGVELKRDMEVILLDNNKYETGGTTTVRECAGLMAYITNTDVTGGPLNYTAAAGTGADAWVLTNATAQALNLTILTGAMKNAFIQGGKPNLLMLSPTQKVNFSRLALGSAAAGAVQLRYNLPSVGGAALIGAVEKWQSDFGAVDVAVNVQMASDTSFLDKTAFLVDTRFAAVEFLRPFMEEDLAKTGDNTKRHILAEYSLKVGAPKAHAAVFALS